MQPVRKTAKAKAPRKVAELPNPSPDPVSVDEISGWFQELGIADLDLVKLEAFVVLIEEIRMSNNVYTLDGARYSLSIINDIRSLSEKLQDAIESYKASLPPKFQTFNVPIFEDMCSAVQIFNRVFAPIPSHRPSSAWPSQAGEIYRALKALAPQDEFELSMRKILQKSLSRCGWKPRRKDQLVRMIRYRNSRQGAPQKG